MAVPGLNSGEAPTVRNAMAMIPQRNTATSAQGAMITMVAATIT